LVRERTSTGNGKSRGIGMPSDYPGGLASLSDPASACRTSLASDKCGGAILQDDVKSRSVTVPIQSPVPSDSFYDAAAFRMTCSACNPENNVIRSTLRPVLGPKPGESAEGFGILREGPNTTSRVLVKMKGIDFDGTVLLTTPLGLVTIQEAKTKVFSDPSNVGFSYPSSINEEDSSKVNATMYTRIQKGSDTQIMTLTKVNPSCISYVIEFPSFFYLQSAIDFRSYLYSRCLSMDNRKGRGYRIKGKKYFTPAGAPANPSDDPDIGPPSYFPPGCSSGAAQGEGCTIPYKVSNPRFGVQGAVSCGSRVSRLRYEYATRGSRYLTSGAFHAKNFGEMNPEPLSGYFLAQNFRVDRCDPQLYRRTGNKVGCFRPEPTALDRIEH
jgi:hypothetical protein